MVRHGQGYTIVTAARKIDISTATKLRERLFELAASGRPLVADLDEVSKGSCTAPDQLGAVAVSRFARPARSADEQALYLGGQRYAAAQVRCAVG